MRNLEYSSEIIKRYFVDSIFIGIDIDVKEGRLFHGSVSKGSDTRFDQVCVCVCFSLLFYIEMNQRILLVWTLKKILDPLETSDNLKNETKEYQNIYFNGF